MPKLYGDVPPGFEPPPKATPEELAEAPAKRAAYEQSRDEWREAIGQPLGEYTRKGKPR